MRKVMTWTMFALMVLISCRGGPRARSEKSYDEIAQRVVSMNAAQIAELLGEPDSRQPAFGADERWLWWNFTFLAGEDYPPEIRGRVVHLEITLRNPADPGVDPPPYSQWRVAEPFGVAYRSPKAAASTKLTHEIFGDD